MEAADDTIRRRGPRSDAARNHAALRTAALDVLTRGGVDAPLDEIARSAGVGVGTLYRHFPSRDDLLLDLYRHLVDELVDVLEHALAAPDAWSGLERFVEGATEVAMRHPRFVDVARRLAAHQRDVSDSERLSPGVVELVERARAAGVLGRDIELTDVVVIPMLLARLDVPRVRARHLELALRSLRADPLADGPAVAAVSAEEYTRFVHGPLDDS